MSRHCAVHLCSFTSLDDLKPKQRRDPEVVLAVLRETGRFSAFDMYDMKLVRSVETLKDQGRIRTDPTKYGFPWVAVEITDKGMQRSGRVEVMPEQP